VVENYVLESGLPQEKRQDWKTLLGFFFHIMELSLKSIKVWFKVVFSEMQTSCLHQCMPNISATRKQPLPSLISHIKTHNIWRGVGFFSLWSV